MFKRCLFSLFYHNTSEILWSCCGWYEFSSNKHIFATRGFHAIIFPTRFESMLSAFMLQACIPEGLFLHLFEFCLLGFTAFDKKPVGGFMGLMM